jgi:HEAT repeat protein
VKSITEPDLSASQRRNLEQALVDLVLISKDAKISPPVLRQSWQGQVTSLGKMSRHPKTSVRLTSLSILEALGSDAQPAVPVVQQSLTDSDRFIRWAAVRALQAIGIDSTSRQMLAKMQKDDDASVRLAAQLALQTPAATGDAMAKTNRPALDLTVPMQPAKENKVVSIPANTSGTTEQPAAEALHLPTPVKPPVKTPAPALLPATIPQTPVPLPEKKAEPKGDPVPLFSPPPSTQAPAKQAAPENKNIQTTSSVMAPKQEPKVDLAAQWIPKLRQGTVDQQLQAVHELGKLGPDAARAVLPLAEMLLKGNVVVKREIPLTLMKIGAPAKLATAVLERSLQDSDTDVKVNAARALLELADK